MKKTLLLTSIAFFIACGKNDTSSNSPSLTIDRELQPYYQNFQAAANRNKTGYGASNLTVVKLSLESEAILTPTDALNMGHCETVQSEDGNYHKELFVDPAFTNIQPEDFKNKVFLHEIGHCAYHLSDSPEFDFNAIMRSPTRISNKEDFEDFKQQFFDDARANEVNWNNTAPV